MRAKPWNAKFDMESVLNAIIRYARQALEFKIRYGIPTHAIIRYARQALKFKIRHRIPAKCHKSLCALSLEMQNSLLNLCSKQ